MSKLIVFFGLLLTLLFSVIGEAAEKKVDGKLLRISDGDTVGFVPDAFSYPIKLRLWGIDCPEEGQRGYLEAKVSLGMFSGARGEIEILNVDGYNRYVSKLFVVESRARVNVSVMQLEKGLCWWYRDYAPNNPELQRAEEQAQALKIGIWSEKDPKAPWVFRAEEKVRKREGKTGK